MGIKEEATRAREREVEIDKAEAVLDETERCFDIVINLREDYEPGTPAYRALTLAGYEILGRRPS